ncbi:metallophosphoesterase 1 homolog [Sitodiplosis mosellana]|uniref:metallophosphoesterase 1 homolog n=1 Tax=Sitodiplosis mosellana TaxID=263140 RepID=UPI002444CB48|nr:metallophosphoesterase 1 homolog [Sitodiplosis mosellana]
MFFPRLKRYFLYATIIISFVLISINEFFIYSLHRLSWSSIRCRTVNCTTILFVSDPQLLGETFDTSFYSGIANHDSDQYLRKTYARAYAYAKPDVVCFLGDLLDEGSIAAEPAYQRYLDRFKNVFKTSASIKKFYIPGDNDIGGEGSDYATAFKTNRFHRSFNETSKLVINNRLRLLNINLLTHTYPDLNETYSTPASHKLLNIVLTHLSVLSYPGLTMKTIIDQFKPNIIFSGHSHLSRVITYPPQNIANLVDYSVVKVNLNNFNVAEHHRNFTEIAVPASSYRMGVDNIGYGYAVIDGDELQYTVLWSPDRFQCLYAYVIWLALMSLAFLVWILRNCSLCHRRVTYRFRLMIATDKF